MNTVARDAPPAVTRAISGTAQRLGRKTEAVHDALR